MVGNPRKKRERSPSYPAIGLEEAIQRARTFYAHERRNPAPLKVVAQHWGYSPTSSGFMGTIAALKRFGLIPEEGSGPDRRVRLSDAAFKIIIDERPDSEERLRLLQEAALKPTVHADLWERYGTNLPSDANLRYELRTRGFTDTAAVELVEEYKRTIEFAQLGSSGTLSPQDGDKPDDEESTMPAVPTEQAATPQRMPLQERELTRFFQATWPLSPNVYAEFSLSGTRGRPQVTVHELQRLRKYIDLSLEALQEQDPNDSESKPETND